MIVNETKVSGDRAKRIADRLPLDGAIFANSFGFSVYGNPRFAERHLLWDNLKIVVGLHSMPWVIAGDFNEVLMGEDKFGGKPVSLGKALLFKECLDTCKMVDIGFSGPRYTWSNHRPLAHLVQEQINRVFFNAEWNGLHPEAVVLHLEKTHLVHGDSSILPLFFKKFRNMSLF